MTTATLDGSLGEAAIALLDSSVLMAYHVRSEATHPLARHLMDRIADPADPLEGCFSVISAVELLVRPYQTGTAEFEFISVFLTTYPNLSSLPVDLAAASSAAMIRSRTGLRLPDAIVIASGLLAGCQAVVTNDREWHLKLAHLFPDIAWIYLGDHV